jgi:hypothetical protein
MRSLLLSLLVACGGGSTGEVDASAEGPDADSSGVDATPTIDCDGEPADVYAPGMIRTGANGAMIELVSSDPAPPARFYNTFIVRSPGGPITAVTPFMPAHGHGTQTPVVITATGNPDEYELDPVDLWMPGLWEVRIDVDYGDASDRIVFRFCIAS